LLLPPIHPPHSSLLREDPGLDTKLTPSSLRCLASVLSLAHSPSPFPLPPLLHSCPLGKEDPGLAKKRREWQAKQDAEKAKEDAEKQQQQQQAELQQAEAAAAAAVEGALVDPLAFAEDAAAGAAGADGVAAVDAAAEGAAAAVVPEAAAAAGKHSIVSEYTGEAEGGRAGAG
jgi:hypothetical protein